MPRVHGIDAVPRRGRRRAGLASRVASSSSGVTNNDNNSITDGAENDATSAASLATASLNLDAELKQNPDDRLLNELNDDNDASESGMVGGDTQMTLDDTSKKHSLNNTKDGNDDSQQESKSPTTPFKSKEEELLSDDNLLSTPTATESQETTIISNKTSTKINTTSNNNYNTSNNDNNIHSTKEFSSVIKPQSKDSIENLEFGSHSFSVPSITKKSVSKYHDYNDFGGGGTALSLFGIGPSLDTLQEEEESKPAEQNDSLDDEKDDEKQSSVTITPLNPNAQWLYNQCSTAKSKMEYPHSALKLATKTLLSLRQHYHSKCDSDTDEDERIQTVQNLLFELIAGGKKRDLQFVFDVSSRSFELSEDEGLTVEALRDVAIDCCDAINDCGYDNNDCVKDVDNSMKVAATPKKDVNGETNQLVNKIIVGDKTPDTAAESTPSPQKRRGEDDIATSTTTPASSMRKSIRSRRKKRQNGRGNETTNTKEKVHEKTNLTETDFRIQNRLDELSMQVDDDEKWSFLSSPQGKGEDSNVENTDENERGQQSPEGATDVKQSIDFAVEEEVNDIAMMQDDAASVENELAVLAANKAECSDEVEEDSIVSIDMATNTSEIKEDAKLMETELTDLNENDFAQCEEVKEDNQEEVIVEEEKDDSVVQTAALSSDQPDASTVRTNSNSTITEPLPSSEIPTLQPDKKTDSDEESKSSQQQSDLIDEVKLSSRKRNDRREAVRIMFTGVTPTRRHMQMIETIGAELVVSIEMAHTVTHVIVTDGRAKLRRTPKLMICICKTSNILSTEWLEQSAYEQKVLDATPFLLLEEKEAESKYNFTMKDTLRNGVTVREHRGGVFGGYSFYICSDVAGNRAPTIKEFKLIIEAAGGHLLNNLAPSEILDPLKTVILTSDPATPSQLKERGVKNIAKCGGSVQTTSWLFHSIITQTNSIYQDDDTVESVSTPGSNSKVSYEEPTTPLQEKLQDAPSGLFNKCTQFLSRENFFSDNQTSWMETLESSEEEAVILAHRLWQNYFNDSAKSSKTPRKMPSKATRRLRGRNHSLSPMVGTSSTSSSKKDGHAQKKESVLRDNPHLTWEAIVLFTLQIRVKKLEAEKSSQPKKLAQASVHFSSPNAVQTNGKTLSLLVNAVANDPADNADDTEIFGTLNDVFTLHQKRSSGMIPEPVIASFALMAIEAVSAMHAYGVVHNNIGLDSFLVVQRGSSLTKNNVHLDGWCLQLIGFNTSSLIRTYNDQNCDQTHYEHDYNCLANVIHQLLTGGNQITFNIKGDESVEFTSKQFLSGNMFLRGALSWCALIDALLGIGDAQRNETSDQSFRVNYPVDFVQHVSEDDAPNKRFYQFGWSCRMLVELQSTKTDGLSTFLQELSALNSRFLLSNVKLDTYTYNSSPHNQTFEFATQLRIANENKRRVFEFARKAAEFEEVAVALERRESHLRDQTAQLKIDSETNERLQKSLLERQRQLEMRENEIAHKLAGEEERLKRMKQTLLLREQRLEQRIRQIKEGKQYTLDHHDEQDPHHSYPSLNSNGLKRKSENLHHTPPSTNSKFQSLGESNEDEEIAFQKRRRLGTVHYDEPCEPPPLKWDTNGVTKEEEVCPQQELNCSESESDSDLTAQQNESSQESRFSQGSSSQKRKRVNRGKSPLALKLDSLQSLPKSPKKQPKKVFVAFEE